tara:strand:- start:68576 stop:72496 length:3921 start_codon:yes stop_codon:yes gene_type:complete
MKIRIVNNTTLIVILLLGTSLYAQEEAETSVLSTEAPSLRFEHLKVGSGLAQGSANTIMQDSQGFIWVSTQGGLHRYDGHDFKLYANTPFDTTSISDSWVWSVSESKSGDLWVSTNGGGLNKMDRATGTFISYTRVFDDSTSISNNSVQFTLEAENGDLWVTTNWGLNRMKAGEDGKFERFFHDHEDLTTISSNGLYLLNEDSEGNIWIGSNNGLNKINPTNNEIARYLNDPVRDPGYGDPLNVLSQYFPQDEPGFIWLATGNGLVKFEIETGDYERFLIEPNTGGSVDPLNFIHEIVPDPSVEGILWVVGPGTGVARFDTRTNKFTSYRNDPKDPNSLAEDFAVSIFADRSGTIWIGYASEGLSAFNPKAVNFAHLKHDPDNPQSLSPGIVWGVYEDKEGTLWVGTESGQGISYLTSLSKVGNKDISKVYQHDPNDKSTLTDGLFRVFAEDPSGNFWVASNRGLNKLNRKTGKVTRFLKNWDRLNNINMIQPTKDDSSVFWVGTSAGLSLLDTKNDSYEVYPIIVDTTEVFPFVLSLHEDSFGNLWLGTGGGLGKITKDGVPSRESFYNPRDTTSISNDIIFKVVERPKEPGILWLATQQGGLNRYDTNTGIATHYGKQDGIADDHLYSIILDDNETLWMSSNNGIINFDPETETFRNYGLDDGLMALEYNQNAYSKSAEGIIYFGSGKGVTAFNPERLNINEIPPQVVFSDFRIFNKTVAVGADFPLKKALSETSSITIEYNQNEITFEYVALHFANSAKNQYAYQLVGFDRDWVQAEMQRSATYTNLSPGDYTFRVKAANADGIWNENYASIELIVLPPWYRTWWAYGVFAGLLALLVFGIDRTQRYRISKKEQERTALREAELRAEAENKRRSDTEQLSMIGRAITSTLSVDRIIETVYENVNALMDAAIFGVGIYNKELDRLEFPATKEKGVMLPALSYSLDENDRLAVICFNKKEEIIISDWEKEHKKYVSEYKAPLEGEVSSSVIYIPLIFQGKIIGVITTQSFKKDAYSEYHINLLRNLATYAAIALDNASAYRKLNSTLSELKTMQQQLVQQEKLASLGQLTAGIAHEIKNPLNFVTNFSDLNLELLEEARELSVDNEDLNEILDDIEANLKKIHEHGSRADRIVKSMLQHSRGGSGSKTPTLLNGMVKEYVNLAFHGMRAGKNAINVDLQFDLEENINEVSLIVEDFSRVVVNLCNNAFDAMRGKIENSQKDYKPKLTVRTKIVDGKVILEIEDNGPGIPDDIKDKIMQPFFTTKMGTDGTGLGLSITNDIIKAHGGELEVESKENQYTLFRVYLK